MTNIPVAGLYTSLELDPTQLENGVNQAARKLNDLREAMARAGTGAGKAGAEVERGMARGLSWATNSARLMGVEFQRLSGKLDPLASGFSRLDREASKLDRQLSRGVISANAHAAAMQTLRDRGLASVSAEADRLRMKLDPLYASSKRYEGAVLELNRALEIGAISQGRYDTSLEQMNAQLAAGATSFGNISTQAKAYNTVAGATSFQTGNIAAQFQDIGVQLAGGQSPFLIALQQGTQLQGVLSQMGGGLRGVFKSLGSAFMSLVSPLSLITVGAIAAGGALVQWAFSADDATEASKELEEQQNRTEAAFKSLQDRAEDRRLADAIKESGAASKEEQIIIDETNRLLAEREALQQKVVEIERTRAKIQLEVYRGKLKEVDAQIAANRKLLEGEENAKALAEVDIASGIAAAASSASELARRLGLSVDIARKLAAGGFNDTLVLDPRDPRYDPGKALRKSNFGFDYNTTSPFSKELEKIEKSATGGGGGGAAKALSDTAKEAKKLREEMQRPLVSAIDGVSDAFGDFISRGFKDFKGFTKSILNSFKSMLSQMIATALKNRILIGLGIGGSSIAGTASAASGLVGGGGGLLAGLLGSGGAGLAGLAGSGGILGAVGGVASGLSGVMSGGLISGIGQSFTALGGLASGAVGGLGAFGAAIPALGAIGVALSFFRKKVKELDTGIRLTTSGMVSAVETFRTTETKRFFGLSKKTGTSFGAASAEVADPLQKAVTAIQAGVMDAAKTLNVAGSAFNSFSHQIQISTKGMSDADAQKAIETAITGLGDAFAGMVPGLLGLRKDGEGALAAIQRLSVALTTVNGTFENIGLTLFDASVSGAGAASAFADLLDGIEGFTQVTSAYYQNFFTDAERTENATNKLTQAFADLGLVLPTSRDAFRAMVEAADAAGDRDLVAKLLKLSPAFAGISAGVEDTVARINQALADLKPEDFATALDFNRARGALASGISPATAPAAVQASLSAATGGGSDGGGSMTEVLLANINSNIALLWKTVQKFDYDGMPPVRA
jgi:hypothetical protein